MSGLRNEEKIHFEDEKKIENSGRIIKNGSGQKHLVIILGSSIHVELGERIQTGYTLYESFTNNDEDANIVLTGTPGEVNKMRKILKNTVPDYDIYCEEESKTTIDNIYNSFTIFSDQINEGWNVHIVTSDYHLLRVKKICDILDPSKNVNVNFHCSRSRDSKIFEDRIQAEFNIISVWNDYLRRITHYNEKRRQEKEKGNQDIDIGAK